MSLGMDVGLGPGDFVFDGDPATSKKKGTPPNFWPVSIVAKQLHGSRCHLVRTVQSLFITFKCTELFMLFFSLFSSLLLLHKNVLAQA